MRSVLSTVLQADRDGASKVPCTASTIHSSTHTDSVRPAVNRRQRLTDDCRHRQRVDTRVKRRSANYLPVYPDAGATHDCRRRN